MNIYNIDNKVHIIVFVQRMTIGQTARLNHIPQKPIPWKGKTFAQITSFIKKTNGISLASVNERTIMKARPLKHYRREIGSISSSNCKASSAQLIMKDIETPGGNIVRYELGKDPEHVAGLVNTLDITYIESKTERPCYESCDKVLSETRSDSRDIRSLSQQDNALRRVRSSGINRPTYDTNNNKKYFSSTKEYLHNRNRQHSQNEFYYKFDESNGRPNEYRSYTKSKCGGGNANGYVPVYHKPNNAKFAVQGAVDSSSRLARLKYDTITDTAGTYINAFDEYGVGNATANALAYGVPSGGYTVKDKIGYPNRRSMAVSSRMYT